MKLAFCLFKYFPYGGLQRDFWRIAQLCQQRGHHIHVYTQQWEGPIESAWTLHLLKSRGLQNHTRHASFAQQFKSARSLHQPDLVIGFNKMPDLDIYYAADVCYQARARIKHADWYRLLPRYRQLVAFEKAVFQQGKSTQIFMIAPQQQAEFIHHYHTETERFHLLPPGIARDRIAPVNAAAKRAALRHQYHLSDKDFLLLLVGSGFKTKGLDRALRALATLPQSLRERCHFWIIGDDNPRAFNQLIRELKIAEQIKFLGGRADVADFLLAADVLLHPAYHENTGTVLLEAAVAGLPVLTTENCGYAHYIRDANLGTVLTMPFQQVALNVALQTILSTPEQPWRQNSLHFANHADIYRMPEHAVALIEKIGREQQQVRS